MKKGSKLLLLLLLASCSCLSAVIAAQQTCPADLGTKCEDGASRDWEGEFFPAIPKIKYEGPTSKNPLAYKWYNAEEVILGKKMKDWMRFSVAFWHTFRGSGADPFGAPTMAWPWEDGTNSLAMAKRRMRAHFEFMEKLGVDKWCFHDRDIAPDAKPSNEGCDVKEGLQGGLIKQHIDRRLSFSHVQLFSYSHPFPLSITKNS